ncbi:MULTISPECIES: hypothetical protein [Bacillus cereus group]|nr:MULTISPECIES: hypothetical protein [Bacillus cereus group]
MISNLALDLSLCPALQKLRIHIKIQLIFQMLAGSGAKIASI